MNNPQFQCQIPIGNLPVNLVLVGNRQQAGVVFVKVQNFAPFVDQCENGFAEAAFYSNDFVLFGGDDDGETVEEFVYNTIYYYKEIPAMLKWLQKQDLQKPENIFFG